MIPRKILFGNPENAHVRLSPDGSKLAWLAPDEGVLNIRVGPRSDPSAARVVTSDRHRGIRSFFWAYTNRHVLYTQDTDGDEDWHLYSVDLETGKTLDLTPFEKIAARVQNVSRHFPEDVLVGINDRNERHFHDIYRINLRTGERTLIQENPGFAAFMTDDQFRVRFAVTFTPDAGQQYLSRDGKGDWKPFMSIEPADTLTTHAAGFDKTGDGYYIVDSRGRDKSALKYVLIDSGEETLLAESDLADIDDALFHPTERRVEAASFTYDRQQWIVLDPEIADDLEFLGSVADGEAQISSRTLDDTLWTVAFTMDTGPVRFYVYDRARRRAEFLFSSQPELEGLPLTRLHPVKIPARDGLEMVGYLSVPAPEGKESHGRPAKPLPMVLLVHGGPWARDTWGFSATHQWLADRGYAVLAVNFRGSTGFGKSFINKGNREWAAAMHDDLLDAVDWAVREKIAEPDRVAIMGGSYGGYATLVGLTFTPERFACGVDIVGPSNLVTLMDNPPPYWMPLMSQMKLRVGDFSTDEGRRFLESRSPLFQVDRIVRPLLIGQGRQDPRVKQAESDQIVDAMRSKGIPVTYMLFTDEGHGFAKPENRLAFFAVTEAFLARHLGGAYEPVGDAFSGAAFTVPEGRDGVPGLAESLKETAV